MDPQTDSAGKGRSSLKSFPFEDRMEGKAAMAPGQRSGRSSSPRSYTQFGRLLILEESLLD